MTTTWNDWSVTELSTGELRIRTPTARQTSVCSDTGWIAKIVGRHPKYRFQRVFCGRRGDFVLPGPGLYEYRNICGDGQSNHAYNKYGGESGYFMVSDQRELSEVSEDDALEIAAGTSN